MPERQQDHGRIPVTVAVALGSLDQLHDLVAGQVLSGSQLGVWLSGWPVLRANCS
jgi:hypothetical protein